MARPLRRANTNDAGLTLIEMVVSIGIVMAVLVAVLSVFVTAKKAQATAEGTDGATQLATSQLEQIRQLDWRDIGFDNPTYVTATTAGTKGATATTAADYAAHMPSGESSVRFTTPPPITLKPYATVTDRNTFTVYTTITWGVEAELQALNPTQTSATTLAGQYTFKRVRVTVEWKSGGSGAAHTVTNETWFAPDGSDEAPPSVTDIDYERAP